MSKALVSNVDYAQTFLDMAGLPSPAEMQGRSLKPLLAGETPADWRKEFYYHYYEYPQPHHVARAPLDAGTWCAPRQSALSTADMATAPHSALHPR